MIELLKEGTRVKVHPLEWFEISYKYVANDGKYDYYSLNGGIDFLFASDMKKYCDKYVTIKRSTISRENNGNSLVIFKIEEDNGIRSWISDFFDLSTITNDCMDNIKSYCSELCVLKDDCRCRINNLECSLGNNIKIDYDYINSCIRYSVRVHSKNWFDKNCKSKNPLGSYLLKNTDYVFAKDMSDFCGEYVTIKEFIIDFEGKCRMKVEEDTNDRNWVVEFFDILGNDHIYNIESYCSDFCVLGDRSKCNNSECYLYKYGSDIKGR